MNTRTHLSLGKDVPAPRPVTKPFVKRIVETPWSTGFIIAATVWLHNRWFEGSCSFIHHAMPNSIGVLEAGVTRRRRAAPASTRSTAGRYQG